MPDGTALSGLLGRHVTVTGPNGSSWTGRMIVITKDPGVVIEQADGKRVCLPQAFTIAEVPGPEPADGVTTAGPAPAAPAAPAVRRDWPLAFALQRQQDVTGVSGTGIVAYGAQFADGQVVLRWTGEYASTVIWESLDAAMNVHGHDGKTTVAWAGCGKPSPRRTGASEIECLARISDRHARETGPAGTVGDYCVDCEQRWPCSTRRLADGTYPAEEASDA